MSKMSAVWPNTVRVQIVKRLDTGLGFDVKEAADPPYLTVSTLVPGGAAEESGLVVEGDRIVNINGGNLSNLPFRDTSQALHNTPVGSSVVLLLRTSPEYITHLETIFTTNGQPFTVRVTKPLNALTIENQTAMGQQPGPAINCKCNGIGFVINKVFHIKHIYFTP